MADLFTLTCPSCGGKLQVTNDIERFACGYCGQEHIVKRSGGIISLSPVVEGLKDVKVGVDKTASELAILRLEKEISVLVDEINNLDSRRNSGSSSRTWIVLIGGFFVFTGLKNHAIFGIIVGILMIGIVIWKSISQNTEINNEIMPIQENLEDLQKQLLKHKKIVSS